MICEESITVEIFLENVFLPTKVTLNIHDLNIDLHGFVGYHMENKILVELSLRIVLL